MKKIGLIGGITWLSTIEYYRNINKLVNEIAGGHHSAEIILVSVNFQEISDLTHQGNWSAISEIIIHAARKLETAGADCILLCANTMHLIAGRVQQAVQIPLLHIADITTKAIEEKNIRSVLLLGTKYTMTGNLYNQFLQSRQIELLIPEEPDRNLINDFIYNELGKGLFLQETRKKLLEIIDGFKSRGVEGVILGCTEIPMILSQEDSDLHFFDTCYIHAKAAAEFAFS